MTRIKTTTLALVAALTFGAFATAASAQTRFEDNHPRRAEVVERAHHQLARIRDARQEGEISGRQAHRLRVAEQRVIRREERMALRHGGRITQPEQHRLNEQENRIGRHIPG